MQTVSTVTQKGQVTIPKSLREHINIDYFDKVYIEAVGDHLRITPAIDILNLAKTYVPKKKKSLTKARRMFERSYRRF